MRGMKCECKKISEKDWKEDDIPTHQAYGYITSFQYSFPYNINSRLIGAWTLEEPTVTSYTKEIEMDGEKE